MQSTLQGAASLLIEFLTEELPPINLEKNIGESFAINLHNEIKSFVPNQATLQFFVTPRRFGCLINQVNSFEATKQTLRRGPAINHALKDNLPTKALLGFANSCNIANWQELEQHADGYFYAKQIIKGKSLEEVLPTAIINALKKLPISKNMRWGNNNYQFVRPIHNLVILHGNQVLCHDQQILGVTAVNYTFGHRIMSSGKIVLAQASDYLLQLEQAGKVLAKFSDRKAYILKQLHIQALNLTVNQIHGLVDEVTALVEYPVVLAGQFDASFLSIPQECLILSMAKNQKYFALLDNNGKLVNKFLFVANLISTKPQMVINGNQKVLSARLADAKFFYELDKQHPLSKLVEKLANVVYHHQLGTQLQRITRLQNIASQIAPLLNLPQELAMHTAYLLKADLASEMVKEFPELQGIMGKYYALHQGEKLEVALAIEKHYSPRFSGDEIPKDKLAIAMALTDKLEALVGIWGSGLIPSGDKDPFALRRIGLGIARILLVTKLNLKHLLTLTYATFAGLNLAVNTCDSVYQFILQRLHNYLTAEKNYDTNCVQSILSVNPCYLEHSLSLLDKLQKFAKDWQNQPLLNANKRIENILKKVTLANFNETITESLLQHDAEKALFTLLKNNQTIVENHAVNNNWQDYFAILAQFNVPITHFFDQVMVMDDNLALRHNRIALLQKLYNFLNTYCKLSELS